MCSVCDGFPSAFCPVCGEGFEDSWEEIDDFERYNSREDYE
jgi:hypothetical protein